MKFGSATAVITPHGPQVLGASGTTDPVASVRDDLEVNVVTLATEQSRLAIISLDLLYPGRLIRLGVESALRGVFEPDEIFLAASHTHYAPAVDIDKPKLGKVDTDYIQFVVGKIAETVSQAAGRQGDESEFYVHSGYAASAVNRRSSRLLRFRRGRLSFNEIGLGPNLHGSTNETVTTVVFGPRERPHAVLWGYACHPTSLPQPRQVSSHFPGYVREAMRNKYSDPAMPVIYLQGFSGDIRPPAVAKVTSLESAITRARLGRVFGDFAPAEYQRWLEGLSAVVMSVLSSRGRALREGLVVARVELPLSEFVVGTTPTAQVSFHGFAIDSLAIVGVSGELVTEYTHRLQSHLPGHQAVGVGCIDETFGYVPTEAMLGTGGYEDSGYCRSFEVSEVRQGIERATMKGFEAVASQLVSGDSNSVLA